MRIIEIRFQKVLCSILAPLRYASVTFRDAERVPIRVKENNRVTPYPIMHPTTLCITSSVSQSPFLNISCNSSITTDNVTPMTNARRHVIPLNPQPANSPTGMNSATFRMLITATSLR